MKCKILLSQEANSTFRILLNESTRRLKLLSKKLGSCIEKARPFYEAQDKARIAQIECQAAAVKFQRANGNLNKQTYFYYNLFMIYFWHEFKCCQCLWNLFFRSEINSTYIYGKIDLVV